MIISHKHKFIFVKTKKTAGTSVEIALSKYCGEEDVITPVVAEDEAKRTQYGYRGPQNYRIPLRTLSGKELAKRLIFRDHLEFYNHISADYIRRHIDPSIWNSYYKFCFERNPWDKAVSWYYWISRKGPQPSLAEFIQSAQVSNVSDFELYTKNSEMLVDKVFKYEDLESALNEISDLIGLGEPLRIPRTKVNSSKTKLDYKELLSEREIDRISKVFAREIAYLGYEF